MEEVKTDEKDRGGCLTRLLVLVIILNTMFGIFYFVHGKFPNMPEWVRFYFAFFSIATTGCCFGIWKWKKWGVIFLFVIQVICLVFALLFISVLQAVAILIWTSFFFFLIKPVWRYME